MDGTSIESKIEEIGIETIKYYKFNYLSGPSYIILKRDVSKIVFENGTVDIYQSLTKFDPIFLEEAKKVITENINEYGYEHAKPKRKYFASFDNDYLRISIPTIYDVGEPKNGIIYDFSRVIEFHNVSKRKSDMAYVNVWVMECRNKKKDKWRKYKLVICVKGHDKAKIIMDAMKNLNELLLLQVEQES